MDRKQTPGLCNLIPSCTIAIQRRLNSAKNMLVGGGIFGGGGEQRDRWRTPSEGYMHHSVILLTINISIAQPL